MVLAHQWSKYMGNVTP